MSEFCPALRRAIEIVGKPTDLARLVGVTPQALSQWKRVPPMRVLQVEAATGGRVTRHELRPDIYPRPARSKDGEAA